MLAMSRMGFVLMLFLVISLLLYLAIKGIRTGRVGTRSSQHGAAPSGGTRAFVSGIPY